MSFVTTTEIVLDCLKQVQTLEKHNQAQNELETKEYAKKIKLLNEEIEILKAREKVFYEQRNGLLEENEKLSTLNNELLIKNQELLWRVEDLEKEEATSVKRPRL
jgi:hypothetical protein